MVLWWCEGSGCAIATVGLTVRTGHCEGDVRSVEHSSVKSWVW